MRRRPNGKRNPLLDTPLVGALEAARLWGYRSGRSFKRKLPELRKITEIRSIEMLKGNFYVLSDVLRARYQEASDAEIQGMVKEYQEKKISDRQHRNQRRHRWIEDEEAARILGLTSTADLERRLRELPKIQTAQRDGRRLYELRDLFRAEFQEADENQLDQIIIEYKKEQLEQRRRNHENPNQEQD